MNKYIPHLAIIIAALLWSLDAFLRKSLYTLSPLLIITLEHGLGSLLFIPILIVSAAPLVLFSRQKNIKFILG